MIGVLALSAGVRMEVISWPALSGVGVGVGLLAGILMPMLASVLECVVFLGLGEFFFP